MKPRECIEAVLGFAFMLSAIAGLPGRADALYQALDTTF